MLRFLAFGLLFGFLLSRVGATDPDAIARMFLLEDLHLAGVIGVAVLVAGIGMRLRPGPLPAAKPMKPGLLVGAALFGAGWAVTGSCPGTSLAQLGEGRLFALFTIAGILAGTALYGRVGGAVEGRLARLRRGPASPSVGHGDPKTG